MANFDFSIVDKQIKDRIDELTKEHDRILGLPDEEFLKPENLDKLRKIHDHMLTQSQLLTRGKYFHKHYETEEADLDSELECPHCKKIFAVDSKWLQYTTKNIDEDWAICFCPYCGHIKQWCI